MTHKDRMQAMGLLVALLIIIAIVLIWEVPLNVSSYVYQHQQFYSPAQIHAAYSSLNH